MDFKRYSRRRNCCYTLKCEDFPTMWGFVREHQEIEKCLYRAHKAADAKDKAKVLEFLKFFKEQVIPIHFAKEEQIAFLFLNRHLGLTDDLLPYLIHDHHEDHEKVDELLFGKLSDVDFFQKACTFLDEIGEHAELENNTVFCWIEKHLSKEEKMLLKSRANVIGYMKGCKPED